MDNTKRFSLNKATIVAKYFIKKNTEDQKGLDKLKLQKLLYYAQAWNLVLNKEPLFSEKIEAWVHGPVVPEVYTEYKDFDFSKPSKEILEEKLNFTEKQKKVLDSVWEIYGKYDGSYLEVLTHNETPWQEARENLLPAESSNNIISEERMMEYYGKRLKEAQSLS